MRRLWVRVHLWLGLIAGSILALISLTGCLLVFHYEIDAALNPGLMRASQGTERVGPATALAAARQEVGSISVLHMPHPDRPVYVAEYERDDHTHEIFIDPASGDIRGQRNPARSILGIVYDLHNALLLGSKGEVIVGFVGVGALASLATGLYLWWPRKRKFRQALTLKRRAGPVRRNYDWHRVLGMYSLPVLIVLFFSGVYLAFPNTISGLVNAFSPVTPATSPPASGKQEGRDDIGVDGAMAAAQAHWPDATISAIYPPTGGPDAWLLTLQRPGDPRLHGASSGLAVNRYSGDILLSVDPLRDTAGDIFIHWQYPLHTGEAFGMPGRVLVLVFGLLPTLMLLTGYRIWRAKASNRFRDARP